MGKNSVASRMTKRLLADSLKVLMQTHEIPKITVREIVEGCGLNRQTFYYHFQDIYELLEWTIREEMFSRMEKQDSWTNWKDGVISILQYIKENEKICLCAYQSVSRQLLRQFFYADAYDLFRQGIVVRGTDYDVSQGEIDFTAHFYTVGFVSVAEHWLIDGMKESPQELVHNLSVIAEGGIPGVLSLFQKKRKE